MPILDVASELVYSDSEEEEDFNEGEEEVDEEEEDVDEAEEEFKAEVEKLQNKYQSRSE